MMRILVYMNLVEAQVLRLREIAGKDAIDIVPPLPEDAPAPGSFRHADIVFGNVPPHWLRQAPHLLWMQLESVGFGEYAGLEWATIGRGAELTNLAGFFAEPVAESALAGILALMRGIKQSVELKQQGAWRGDAIRPQLSMLEGADAILFGNGSIIRRLAELLAPFRCRVTRFDSRWTPDALDLALAGARVVVAAAPHTDRTQGVFGRDRLALLPTDAILVNFGRGSLVDEEALADALEARRLAGAVLDVTRDEPLPAGHRFWRCPNLILTQHTGGGTADETQRKVDFFVENLARFRAGQPLQNRVDFIRGY